MDFNLLTKKYATICKGKTPEEIDNIMNEMMQEYEQKAKEEIEIFNNFYNNNKNNLHPENHKGSFKECQNLDKNYKYNEKNGLKAQSIFKETLKEYVLKSSYDEKITERAEKTFIKGLNKEDADFIINSLNATPDTIDKATGKTIQERKQEIFEKQVRDYIAMAKEGNKAMTDEEKIAFVEKWGGLKCKSILECEGNYLYDYLNKFGVQLPEDLKNDWETIKVNALLSGSKFDKITEIASPIAKYTNPQSLSIKIQLINSELTDAFEGDVPIEQQEEMNKLKSSLIYSNDSNMHALLEEARLIDSNDGLNYFNLDQEQLDLKYSQCEVNFKNSIKGKLNLKGIKQDPSVNDPIKGVQFKDSKNREITYQEAFGKAMNGEKIKIVDSNNNYLMTAQSSIQNRGDLIDNAKKTTIDFTLSTRSAYDKQDKSVDVKVNRENIEKEINQELLTNLQALGKELNNHNPSYVRNQIGKSKGPYSQAIKKIDEFTKNPNLSKEEKQEKLNEIKGFAQEYLNSKMNKKNFNTLETARFNAMDKILQTLENVNQQLENVKASINAINEKVTGEPTKQKANTKYPLDKDLSEKTIIQKDSLDKEKTLEKDQIELK